MFGCLWSSLGSSVSLVAIRLPAAGVSPEAQRGASQREIRGSGFWSGSFSDQHCDLKEAAASCRQRGCKMETGMLAVCDLQDGKAIQYSDVH